MGPLPLTRARDSNLTLVNSFKWRHQLLPPTATGQEVFHNWLCPFNEVYLYQ